MGNNKKRVCFMAKVRLFFGLYFFLTIATGAIAGSSISTEAATKKPYLVEDYRGKATSGVTTIGATKALKIDGDTLVKSLKVKSSNKKVATVKKDTLYCVKIKGKSEGKATITVQAKTYRYVKNNIKYKTYKLKYTIEVYDASPFLQYVYEENGYKCFKYTGSGDRHIIVPEGVEWIRGFVESTTEFNNDVTSITLPSTLKKMSMYCMFGKVDGDTNWYNCLYQCPNLTSVEGSSIGYVGYGSSVVRPIGEIKVWSNNSRIPYDENAYLPYTKK